MSPVLYYVHHDGAGHGALGAALSRRLGLIGAGSGGRPAAWRGEWLDLPRDDVPPPPSDPTRGGAWHWAPAGHAGHADRMRALAALVAERAPAALVSDVSCEVAVLGALLGVPTATVVLPGRRDDRPHRLAWDSADVLVAPWSGAERDPGLAPWRDRLEAIGLASRFDDRPVPPPATGREVLVLLPSGSHTIDVAAVVAAAAATPGWRWTVAGTGSPRRRADGVRWLGRVADPWPLLAEAAVVVAAAGLGSVAEVAAARRPAVLLPQDRPFGEQHAHASELAGVAPVVVADRWPAPTAWAALLDRAAGLAPARWDALHDRRGAERFAAVIARVSGREPEESGRACRTSLLSPVRSGPRPTAPDRPSPPTSAPTSWSSGVASPG